MWNHLSQKVFILYNIAISSPIELEIGVNIGPVSVPDLEIGVNIGPVPVPDGSPKSLGDPWGLRHSSNVLQKNHLIIH